ncbi:MAG TPA: M56 family metallopeptidase [Candidatus Eisenbacteria bacterium]|nr:M56 family metallopeptidase [Candidatus Eisenbacteria bacterium]
MSAPLGLDRASVDALGWTLMHFIWQGASIAFFFAVVNRILSRAGANARYLLACGTLLLMLLAPVATFVALRDAASASRVSVLAPPALRSSRAPLDAKVPSAVLVPSMTVSSAPRLNPTLVSWIRSARPWMPWLVTMWGIGVILLSIRLLGGWWMVRRLTRSASNRVIPEWQPGLEALARRIGVSRPVRLFRSALVQVPTAAGWLRPVILLPASTLTGLTARQIEAILAHELAHIRRHDYLVNLLQSLVETLLFYHPAVWWVSRRIREERELCCDDLAVRIAGDPLVYADALCRLEQMRGQAESLAVAASGGSLLSRIKRLLSAPPRDDQGSRGLAAVLGAAAVVALMTTPGAQSPGTGIPAATASSRVVARTAVVTKQSTTKREVERTVKREATVSRARGLLGEPLIAEITAASKMLPELAPMAVTSALRAASSALQSIDLIGPEPMVEAQAVTPVTVNVDIEDSVEDAVAVVEPVAPAAPAKGSRSQYTVDEWIALAQHGVSPERVSEYQAAGLHGVPARELMALADNGVSPEFVEQMRRGERSQITTRELIRLAQNGVTPDYANELSELGAGDLSTEELIRLAQNGVTAEWYAAMKWIGYPDLTVERAIRLRQQGVSADYASQLKIVGRRRFTLDELESMRNQGVTPEYVAEMEGAMSNLSSRELIQMRQQGVEPEYVAKMQVAGKFKVPEIIALRQQGVEPEYVFEMSAAGYPGLATPDLIRLRQAGVDAEFVVDARDAGYPKASVSEIIRLRQHGLPCSKSKNKS